jgi:hypothetical protein
VSITGTAQVGQTLTANVNNLGGSGTITYQWLRGGTNIGTNNSTYVVQSGDVGSTISVRVTRANNSGSITSPATATVTAAVPATPSGVSATAETSSSIRINWFSVPGAAGYNVYRSTSASGAFALVGTTTTTTFTNTGLSPGTTFHYRVSAFNSTGESSQSSAVSAFLLFPNGHVFNVTNETQWLEALRGIRESGNNKAYTITVSGRFSVPGSAFTSTSLGSVTGISVTLNGSGTLSLSSNGSILIVGVNQTLIINGPNLILEGRSGNNRSVISASGNGSILDLQAGTIRNNTTSGSGGGVQVSSNSRFTMSGGTITNNIATGIGGGGLAVIVSTSSMTGGTISGNTGTRGGGVYIEGGAINNVSNGMFYKTGGVIQNNTATDFVAGTNTQFGSTAYFWDRPPRVMTRQFWYYNANSSATQNFSNYSMVGWVGLD